MKCYFPGCVRPAVEKVGDEYLCCVEHAVLKRAGWRCEAIVLDPRSWKAGQWIRCVVVGSEIGVVNGEARCPRHRSV